MLVYGLRLLVALSTFVVGIAGAWLLGSESSCGAKRTQTNMRVVAIGPHDPLPPPSLHETVRRTHCDSRLKLGSDRIVEVEGGILNGKANSLPAPVYPTEARAAGLRGSVAVRVVVSEDGRVTSAEAVGGPHLLRGAAEDAARLATFAPTRLKGNPVRVAGLINYNFSLR